MTTELSYFANSILEHKYAHTKSDGTKETWEEIVNRVVDNVVKPLLPNITEDVRQVIKQRKFIPAGRYLYATGRPLHAICNCLALDVEDSKEGWSDLLRKSSLALMTGAGIGVNYSKVRPFGSYIRGLGGTSSGPASLMNMVNEIGRHVIQGGSRRCLPENTLIYTRRGLIPIKDVQVGDEVQTANGYCKVLNVIDQGEQQTLNISTNLGSFICTANHRVAVYDADTESYSWKEAKKLTCEDEMVSILKPLEVEGETCEEDFAWLIGLLIGDYFKPCMIKHRAYFPTRFDKIIGIATKYGIGIRNRRLIYQDNDEVYEIISEFYRTKQLPNIILRSPVNVRTAFIGGLTEVMGNVSIEPITVGLFNNKLVATQVQNILISLGILASAHPLWGRASKKDIRVRVYGIYRRYFKERIQPYITREIEVFPRQHKRTTARKIRRVAVSGIKRGKIEYTYDLEVEGRQEFIAGGFLVHNSATLASLHWNHKDIFQFIKIKNWSEDIRTIKARDANFPAPMDTTNTSVILDDNFLKAFNDERHPDYSLAQTVYWKLIKRMCKTGEPGILCAFGENNDEYLTNAPLSGDTRILTKKGYKSIRETLEQEVEIWTGLRWAKTHFEKTGQNSKILEVKISGNRSIKAEPNHEFLIARYRNSLRKNQPYMIERIKTKDLRVGDEPLSFLPQRNNFVFDRLYYTLGFLYGDGSFRTPYGRVDLTICTQEKQKCIQWFVDPYKIINPDSRDISL